MDNPIIPNECLSAITDKLKTDIFNEPLFASMHEAYMGVISRNYHVNLYPKTNRPLSIFLVGPDSSGVKDLHRIGTEAGMANLYYIEPESYVANLKLYQKSYQVETIFCSPIDGTDKNGDFIYAFEEEQNAFEPIVNLMTDDNDIYGDFITLNSQIPEHAHTPEEILNYLTHMDNMYANCNKVFDILIEKDIIQSKPNDKNLLKINPRHSEEEPQTDNYVNRQCIISSFIREKCEYAQEFMTLVGCFFSNILI